MNKRQFPGRLGGEDQKGKILGQVNRINNKKKINMKKESSFSEINFSGSC